MGRITPNSPKQGTSTRLQPILPPLNAARLNMLRLLVGWFVDPALVELIEVEVPDPGAVDPAR